MIRILLCTLLFCGACLAFPESASAQNDSEESQNKSDTPPSMFGSLLGESMQTQLTEMATKMLDTYLDYLAKPQTTRKLATFQKNYYDALIEQGFTKDQAFELVLRFGNPLTNGPRASR